MKAPTKRSARADPLKRRFYSDDDTVAYHLERIASGLFVERFHKPPEGYRVYQSTSFHNEESFLRWVEGDPLQFAHLLVFAQIKRAAYELFLFNEFPPSRQDADADHQLARLLPEGERDSGATAVRDESTQRTDTAVSGH